MEKKRSFKWKSIILETTALILITAIAAWAVSTQIHMTAPAGQGSAAWYSGSGQLITDPWDWAAHGVTGLNNGAVLTVWLNNTGTVSLTVTVTILEPTCVITATPQNFQLPVGAAQAIDLTFSGIVGGSLIEWDLKADY